MGDLSRRSFLVGAAMAAGATTIRSALASAVALPGQVPDLPEDPFTLGVASGDPTHDGMVLWTRLAPDPLDGGGMPDVDVPVGWEVLDGPGGAVVASGTAVAPAALAHSVHVEVAGLEPDTWYAYRFTVGSWTSPQGRTRTTPEDGCSPERMTLAAMSCQRYSSGYYTAHRHVADSGPDLVCWLGDYIYENGAAGPPTNVRGEPGGEATTLLGYRNRYALYKSDPDLQASHAACPWLVTWDDHEVDNNYRGELPDIGLDPSGFLDRRAAGYQAWWEHQPVRLPAPAGPDLTIYRLVRWGSLAAFAVLDGRQYRSDHPCGTELAVPCAGWDDEGLSMLGATQEAWLEDVLTSTPATWHVLAQQTVVSTTPFGPAVNMDQWDGFPAARQRLIDVLGRPEVTNPVILTGDIHAAGALELRDGDGLTGATVAPELVATGVSSTFPADLVAAFEAVAATLPHVRYADADRRGYVWVELTPTACTATFRSVDQVTSPGGAVADDFTWVVDADPIGEVGCAVGAPTSPGDPGDPGGPGGVAAGSASAPTPVSASPSFTG